MRTSEFLNLTPMFNQVALLEYFVVNMNTKSYKSGNDKLHTFCPEKVVVSTRTVQSYTLFSILNHEFFTSSLRLFVCVKTRKDNNMFLCHFNRLA